MRSTRFVGLLFFLTACLSGCIDVVVRETVLFEGQSIEATNKNGTIRISYISPTQRKFEWNTESRIVRMIPRPERFDGKLGLYEPADSWGWPSQTRLVVEEAIRNFETEEQLKAALIEGSAIMDWVYTDDGLVVGFGKNPPRAQVDIDLFQFLLNGKKPNRIEGAKPEKIHLTQGG